MDRGCRNPVKKQRWDKQNRLFQCGFSLIELLVVVSIVGLMLTIVVPALEKAKTRVRNVTCQSNLRQWSLSFTMYVEDNNGSFPAAGRNWIQDLAPYYEESQGLLCCPLATTTAESGEGGPFDAYEDRTVEYGGEPVKGSYGLNGWITNVSSEYPAIFEKPTTSNWRKIQSENASNVPILMDSLWVVAYPDVTNTPPEIEGNGFCSPNGQYQMRHFCFDRHGNGTINGLFMDMSYHPVGLKELWRLKWHRNTDLTYPLPKWPDWMKSYKEY